MIFDEQEEWANTLSHALGLLFGILFLPSLDINFATILYSSAFLFLFFSSTIYHGVSNYRWKSKLQKMDHISIYCMIAGSYTPFIFQCLEERQAWIFFIIMWFLAFCGTLFKLVYTGKFEKWSLVFYLSMGWMLVFIIKPFLQSFDTTIIAWVVIGGFSYTIGVYFYANDHKRYRHFIWHLFVLGGALCHFYAISNIIK